MRDTSGDWIGFILGALLGVVVFVWAGLLFGKYVRPDLVATKQQARAYVTFLTRQVVPVGMVVGGICGSFAFPELRDWRRRRYSRRVEGFPVTSKQDGESSGGVHGR